MRQYLIAYAVLLLLCVCCSPAFTQTTASSTPLPCTPAKHGDTRPWIHEREVLSSYPPDVPPLRFVGAFRDRTWDYQLEIFLDAKGLFGELLSPVLEADSPDSRLYDIAFDPKAGSLRFGARFADGPLQFTGMLRRDMVRGTITRAGRKEHVVLRRIRKIDKHPYTSRAQFECAMILFHRY